ncbi:MAG: histidine--tRNA ligase [Bacteroidia bacterium]|nr:histidine--tRNA ligase [Bacteroidia bacterium]
MSKPSIPQGTRDFSPAVMAKRKFIFNTIESVYQLFGFMPLETPAMENLSTLTGKYGNEGDQLLFKILNNGDYLKDLNLNELDSKSLTPKIADRGLRYDLTVPLARYVVMNRNDISFPFKRYQMQPVWRADRPQKGRYREFWQCDADVLGTDSLLCEADFIRIYNTVFNQLGLKDFEIRINHRKLLEAICESCGVGNQFKTITIIIDKADKIGHDGVKKELLEIGLSDDNSNKLLSLLERLPLNPETLQNLESKLGHLENGIKAINDLKQVILLAGNASINVKLDCSLARGLDYYTGCIFEVIPTSVKMGSISGGGRYDDLTGVFGMNGISGIGISFGIDRIFDVMEELNLFPTSSNLFTDILFCPMDENAILYCMDTAHTLREHGFKVEIYPSASKLKKQLDYANDKKILWVAIAGENEIASNQISLKNMQTGEQLNCNLNDIESAIKSQ